MNVMLYIQTKLYRRHSKSSIASIAVVSQMCINIGVIVISVKMHLLTV